MRIEGRDDVIYGDSAVLVIEQAGSRVTGDERRCLFRRAEREAVGTFDDEAGPLEIVAKLNATRLSYVGRYGGLEARRCIGRGDDPGEIWYQTCAFYPSNH